MEINKTGSAGSVPRWSVPDNLIRGQDRDEWCWHCRVDMGEAQQEQYHDANNSNCDGEDGATRPLLREASGGAPDDTNGICPTGSCDKRYWTCPGDAGFKVHRPSLLAQALL